MDISYPVLLNPPRMAMLADQSQLYRLAYLMSGKLQLPVVVEPWVIAFFRAPLVKILSPMYLESPFQPHLCAHHLAGTYTYSTLSILRVTGFYAVQNVTAISSTRLVYLQVDGH